MQCNNGYLQLMKTFITFINITQESTPIQYPVHYPAIQSTECPIIPMSRCALHCTALALNNTNKLNNLNAVTVKRN